MSETLPGAKPHRVVVLGGGMAALSAAWRLTQDEDHEYQITVYQRDHLLGGKGASVRSARSGYGQRIQEHGIHILMGWYDEAIGLLKEVYEELSNDSDHSWGRVLPWERVLLRHDHASMAEGEQLTGDGWEFWNVRFPRRRGRPGAARGVEGGVVRMTVLSIRWLSFFHHRLIRELDYQPASQPALLQMFPVDPELTPQQFADAEVEITTDRAEELWVKLQEPRLVDDFEDYAEELGRAVFDRVGTVAIGSFGYLSRTVRRFWMAFWFAKAIATGLLKGRVRSRKDLEKFDGDEFREWLARYGGFGWVDKKYTWDSPIVRILYDLAFGHELKFAAGVWVYAVLLFALAYKGSFVYKMNGGMGDIVFAPLYLALKKRGVEFCFHHEVKSLRGDDSGEIAEIQFVDTWGLPKNYQAVVGVDINVKGHGRAPAWPENPTMDRASDNRSFYLKKGEDFDSVILGIGIGALPAICTDLSERSPRFMKAMDTAGTTATQAAQIWLKRDRKKLGWQGPDELVAGFIRPFNSCVQMKHVLDSETWRLPKDKRPVDCVYLCDQAPDGTTSSDVKRALDHFLGGAAGALIPQFRYDDLVDPEGRRGAARIEAQFWHANTDASDRYVITPPGSPQHRLAPGESGFENLAVAGDWAQTEINAGCLEAATRAGLAAGDAIIGRVRSASPRRYVETPIDWVRPQPYRFAQARMQILPLRANRAKLTELCHQLINEPSGNVVSVKPLMGCVLLVFADVQEGRSVPEEEDGYLVERECVFFVPIQVDSPSGFKYGALAPAAFVDNHAAVVAGREIYGFPKFPATRIELNSETNVFEVDALALPRFGVGEEAKPSTVVRVGRSGSGSSVSELPTAWTDASRLILEKIGSEMGHGLVSLLSPSGTASLDWLNLVFLKQFRDASNSAQASHQEILRAVAPISNVRGGRFKFGGFRVELPKLARPDLADWLGLKEEQTAKCIVEIDLDFGLNDATRLWSAGGV